VESYDSSKNATFDRLVQMKLKIDAMFHDPDYTWLFEATIDGHRWFFPREDNDTHKEPYHCRP